MRNSMFDYAGLWLRISSLLLIILPGACIQPEDGEGLAKRHCASCHLFPEPGLLEKSKWENGVLPEMKFRMGLDVSKFPGADVSEVSEIMKSIPLNPLVSEEEWQAIREFYLTAAPDSLPRMKGVETFPMKIFAASAIRLSITGQNMVTLIKWDSNNKKIFVGTRRGGLYTLGPSLIAEDSFLLRSPASDVIFHEPEGKHLIACMGIMDPNDRAEGGVVQLHLSTKAQQPVVDSLKRPVDLAHADLNNDGQQDLVISEFGNFTGRLNAYQQTGKGQYQAHFIHNFPGTRKTVVRDMNGDGMPDILALITQGDEQIALFTNRGDFRFSYQVLLKFSPVHGSSYFDLYDFNHDGFPDILYTNGDNADFSYTLKPYHGVRIFMNDGKNGFKESTFFPMHGASMAEAQDYDQDGDLDIAAISFFPDFEHHPENGFIYLENRDGSFIPHTTPLSSSGRWITMESADIDSDGDVDILLGALDFPTSVPQSLLKKWGEEKTSLLIFRNNLR